MIAKSLPLMFLATFGAVPAWASGSPTQGTTASCVASLVHSESGHVGTLVIGAYVEGKDGFYLLTGNYFAGAHQDLIANAVALFGARKIFWMGEARIVDGAVPLLYSANETAGFTGALQRGYSTGLDGSRMPMPAALRLPFENSYLNLPARLLGAGFAATHFGNGSKHLEDSFVSDGGNIRHATRVAFALIEQLREYLPYFKHMSRLQKSEYILDSGRKGAAEYFAARQIVSYMLMMNLTRPEDVRLTLDALSIVQSDEPAAEVFESIPFEELKAEMAKLQTLDLRTYKIK